jgi:hypothetical protein
MRMWRSYLSQAFNAGAGDGVYGAHNTHHHGRPVEALESAAAAEEEEEEAAASVART